MTALLRYRTALLLRSFRWLPPLLLHVAVMGIGLAGGPQPLLDSLGWSAAALLPAAAWLVRVSVTAEPPAARACVAAAAGPGRAHTAGVLAALLCSVVLGTAGTAVVLGIADPRTTDHLKAIPVVPAAVAGLLAALVSALLGTAVGALTNPPVPLRPGWAVPVTALTAVLVLVAAGSPANVAVTGLVTGSRTGAVPFPLVPLLLAALAAAGAGLLAATLSARRG
ncbi:ABC transporter [Streptomyces sp. NPDC001902]